MPCLFQYIFCKITIAELPQSQSCLFLPSLYEASTSILVIHIILQCYDVALVLFMCTTYMYGCL